MVRRRDREIHLIKVIETHWRNRFPQFASSIKRAATFSMGDLIDCALAMRNFCARQNERKTFSRERTERNSDRSGTKGETRVGSLCASQTGPNASVSDDESPICSFTPSVVTFADHQWHTMRASAGDTPAYADRFRSLLKLHRPIPPGPLAVRFVASWGHSICIWRSPPVMS